MSDMKRDGIRHDSSGGGDDVRCAQTIALCRSRQEVGRGSCDRGLFHLDRLSSFQPRQSNLENSDFGETWVAGWSI